MTQFFDKRYCVSQFEMHIVAVAWIFVVVLMALAEATSTQGSLLGASFTFLLYGVLPLAIVMYLMGTPMRRRARKAHEANEALLGGKPGAPASAVQDGDRRGHAAGGAIAPVREEP
jgi:membrane protein implicated in regulation of membrane protease activity